MTVVIKPQVVKVAAEPQQGSVVVKPQQVEIVAKPDKVNIDIGNPIIREMVGGEPYEGSYNVTPAAEQQVLPTSGKLMARDVVVDPIPQNYGLITWSGSVLTVS